MTSTNQQAELADLLKKGESYLKPEQVALVEQAYALAKSAHQGQYRKSGEPYVTHPLAVALILADWLLDAECLAAALLHDVMEDTPVQKEQLLEDFGPVVADLVDGVSKLDRLEFDSQLEAQAESFRKMLFAMARDVRVILIKLADRLHNMRTLDVMLHPKRRRIARETLDIYVPLAERLGLYNLYLELQDLSFRYLYPMRYKTLTKALDKVRKRYKDSGKQALEAIRHKLAEVGLEATVTGREKSLFSVYQKMKGRKLNFDEVTDLYGFRVTVPNMASCYLALGALHALYKPIPGKFKDYIAIPKANGYQSLHTILFGPWGAPIEIQIRTEDMHRIAEAGVAAHWLYKIGPESDFTHLPNQARQWIEGLLENQGRNKDSQEFLEAVKGDLFSEGIYAFTPKGKILALPRGATVIDFAYAVHTELGHRCVGARINQERASLRTELKNGDRVEVITSPEAMPQPAWVNWVTTGRARSAIRQYLKTLRQQELVGFGEKLLDSTLSALGVDRATITSEAWEKTCKTLRAKSSQEILLDLGAGKKLPIVVAQLLLDQAKPLHAVENRLVITGNEGEAVSYAKCCYPLPGDAILGLIKPGQGIVLHQADCRELRHKTIATTMLIEAAWADKDWEKEPTRFFETSLKVLAKNQRGVLAELATVLADTQANIEQVLTERVEDERLTLIHFLLLVANRQHLQRIRGALDRLTAVAKITNP